MTPYLFATMSSVVISVVVVVVIARAWSKASERGKRERELAVGDVASLKPSAVASKQTTLPSSRVPADALTHLAAELSALEVRVVRTTETELIGFFGNANASKVDGMLNTSPAVMPMRIAIRASESEAGCTLAIQIDEDYGFQLFAGPAKSAFRQKNEAATELWTERISGLL